jgi:hypothetical protein
MAIKESGRQSGANKLTKYRSVLQFDDAALYRHLSDPDEWPIVDMPMFAIGAELDAALIEVPTAEEIRRDREIRIEEHRRVAQDLRQFATTIQDDDRRIAFARAAEMHEAIAEVLGAVSADERMADIRADRGALDEAKRMLAEADGRDKFNRLVPDIRTRICTEWHACEAIKQYQDETALTMAIGDVLMTLGAALPIATVATLVVRFGIKKLCDCPA